MKKTFILLITVVSLMAIIAVPTGLSGDAGNSITLQGQKWNFISFFKRPVNPSMEVVFSGLPVQVVWGYDNLNKRWLKFRPSSEGNTLTSIEEGKGYWVYMNGEGSVDMAAWNPLSSTPTHLCKGWNLIGYLGIEGADAQSTLANIPGGWTAAWSWNNSIWSAKLKNVETAAFPALSIFQHGKAYWIKAGAENDWAQRETTAPTLSSSSPADSSTNVAVNSPVTVSFSEAMDASTINTSTFTLRQGSASVSGTVSYAGTTATFTPSGNLLYGAPYTAVISADVKDLAGNSLAQSYTWNFTTGAISTVTEGNVTIEYLGTHYRVAIDLTGPTTRQQTGANYARAIKQMVPQIESIIDSYLSEMVYYSDNALSYVISLANQIKVNIPNDLRDEILGVTSVFQSASDKVSDGILSANEYWALQFLPELGQFSCSALSVSGSSSATGKTIVGRNLDWGRGSSYQLSQLHSVSVIKNGTKSLVSVGFLGLIGCLTCFNDDAVFAAVLQSDTGGPFSAAGKHSYLLDGRYALENYSTLTDVANYLSTKPYTKNHLWFLSDPDQSKVLENCIDAAGCGARGLRSYNSVLNAGIGWGITNAVGAVNSFLLLGNINNHSMYAYNTNRWSSLISQTGSRLGGGNTVSPEEMKEIVSYHSGVSPGDPSAGDLYQNGNVQTIVFQPETFTTDVAFPPVGPLPNSPSFQTIFVASPF